jgi:spore coat polysaccharide biosynthesis predicted glycosyltransferase SpsG
MKICFITDGGAHLGLGHVQQSTAFAKEFEPEHQVFFLTKSDSAVVDKIRENGFDVWRHDTDSEILAHLEAALPDRVIFDKLDVAEETAKYISERMRSPLVIFTNLTGANRYADMAVTADIGSRFENLRYVDQETKTLSFFGPRYWVMRRDFYLYQSRGKEIRKIPQELLLIFGGSDPANLTTAVLERVLPLTAIARIRIVLGAHFQHADDLDSVLNAHGDQRSRLSIHRNVSNVAELMYGADLVLASPGLSAFEALMVGTPVIVIPHNELQRDTYTSFFKMLERKDLSRLGEMIMSGDHTSPAEENIRRMQIGAGVQELKTEILDLSKRAVK